MEIDIKNLTEDQAKEWLTKITKELDNLDHYDFFGSEGWRHYMGFED